MKRQAEERAEVVKAVEKSRRKVKDRRRRASRKKYYREWYAHNKDRVLSDRKDRYKNDPDYRKRIKASMAASKARRSKVAKATERSKASTCRLPTPRKMKVGDKEVTFVSHGTLLQTTGLHKRTLKIWLDRQVLPPCVVRDAKGRRWYPIPYVTFVREMVTLREKMRAEGENKWFLSEFQKIAWGTFYDKRRTIPDVCGVISRAS